MKVYAFALLVVMAMVPAAALEDGGADNRVILDKKILFRFPAHSGGFEGRFSGREDEHDHPGQGPGQVDRKNPEI